MTRRLYWDDPYQTSFEGTIVEKTSDGIVLDKTAFFPQGGGQDCDKGYFLHESASINVLRVYSDEGEIIHKIPKNYWSSLSIGDTIKGIINWEHRYNLMKAHSSQHIISAIVLNEYEIGTSKAYISSGVVALQFDHELDFDQFRDTLLKANSHFASNNVEIISKMVSHADLKKIKGTIRGEIPEKEPIRLIISKDIDVICCGGTHVQNSIEIGPIFIYDFKKGNEIKYYVGHKAVQALSHLNMDSLEIGNQINIKLLEFKDKIKEKLSNLMALNEYVKIVSSRIIEIALTSPIIIKNVIKVFFIDFDVDYKSLSKTLDKLPEDSLLIIQSDNNKVRIISNTEKVTASEIFKFLTQKFGGKGGGPQFNVQGIIKNPPTDLKNEIKEIIDQLI